MHRVGHFIAGQSRSGGERVGPVFNPAKGQQIAEVEFAPPELVDEAVVSARAAFNVWKNTTLAQRTQTMFHIRDALQSARDELAKIITEENGKTLAEARGEIGRAVQSVEYACGISELLKGEHSVNVSTGTDVNSIREPVGVIAGVSPLNFPVMVPMWEAANALACGNTFVLKPSEKVPSASLRLAEVLHSAGLPDGVFNVVQGDAATVKQLLDHEEVDAVSFIGSTPIARSVYARGTASGKRVQALGGAKNHMVVLPDADQNHAAGAAVSAAYGATGERCMAVSVVVAVGDIADSLVSAIRNRAEKLVIGPGTEPGVDFGPLITREHRDKVASYLDTAEQAGATVVLDGREAPVAKGDGFYLGPSLIDHVKPDMACYRDEIFGPVLSIVRVDSYDEAMKLVNKNEFGNGTAVFTTSGATARRFVNDCNIGMVGVNVPIPVPAAHHSFGGWKSSLFGDTHMYGPDSIRFCTRQKVVTTAWPG